MMPHAILIQDGVSTQSTLTRLVEREGFKVASATTVSEARQLLEGEPSRLILTDLHLPDHAGIAPLLNLPRTPVVQIVLVTGFANAESAIEALRLTSVDCVATPIDAPHLQRVLAGLQHTLQIVPRPAVVVGTVPRDAGRFGVLVGQSSVMQRLFDLITRIGPTEAGVLITGESGTGKELVAMTLHEISDRRDKPFLAVNCGAIPADMIESELFGHERGSFTGAMQKHRGYFERAAGGTLFFDEISEMHTELQVKLLRVLESESLVRVGGEHEIPTNVRVLAATNKLPELEVAQKRLREDLYYRLKVLQVELPPLRERGDDVIVLAQHFLELLNRTSADPKQFSSAALSRMRAHRWPGNVRELKNAVHAASILADGEIGPGSLGLDPDLQAEHPRGAEKLRPVEALASAVGPRGHAPVGTTAAEAEQHLIVATLEHCGGDKNEAARMLGVSVKTIYNRLKFYRSATP
jgi:DNA-binding NtrC family response regulator